MAQKAKGWRNNRSDIPDEPGRSNPDHPDHDPEAAEQPKSKKAKPRQQKRQSEFEVPVSFGGVSIGDKTARIGITISRGSLTPGQADKQLCGKRLTGAIVARPEGAGAEQEALPGMDGDTTLAGIFDVKNISITPKKISTGLTFALESIDVGSLAHFAKREGMFHVNEIAELPAGEGDEDGEGDE